MSDEIVYAFTEMSKLLDKTRQTQRIYSGLWKERVGHYEKIIFSVKRGAGWFRKKKSVETDFAPRLRRLQTLNDREKRVFKAIIAHKQETLELKKKIRAILEHTMISGKPMSALMPVNSIDALSAAVNYYLDVAARVHKDFLDKEREFLIAPSEKTLKHAYCSMKHLVFELNELTAKYDKSSDSCRHLINFQENINALFLSVEQSEQSLARSGKDNKTVGFLSNAKSKLRPYFNRNDRQVYGNFAQRVSFNTTDLPRILISIGVRMAVIAPLLIEATTALIGHKPGMRIVPFENYPRFYLDIHLFLISYMAYMLDVVPGLAKYSIETPQRLFRLASRKLSATDTLDLAYC